MSKLMELIKKGISPERLAEIAVKKSNLLDEMLNGVSPANSQEQLRTNSNQALLVISDKHPEVLYKKWDYFADLIKSDYSFSRMSGLYIITNLAKIDREDKFDRISDGYFGLIGDETLPVAAHAARLFGKMALIKPKFEAEITDKLLGIDSTDHTDAHKSLIKAYIIEAFDCYFDKATSREKVLEFIKQQLGSESPKAKKLASKFLKKYDIE